ncbi:hypothetical protein CRUP_001120 [Coryphaenoides rupestris]|nr:hypothetical protein CRUP_001120 [Coryphaenoides rupestris]
MKHDLVVNQKSYAGAFSFEEHKELVLLQYQQKRARGEWEQARALELEKMRQDDHIREPPWGGVASELPYELEILKNGAIVDTLPLTRSSYFVVGRLPVCDVSLEHPSISRYHGVLQCRGRCGGEDGYGEEDEEGGSSSSSSCSSEAKGFYIHDLGSTHGTVVNKNKIPPQDGPEFDEERESELTQPIATLASKGWAKTLRPANQQPHNNIGVLLHTLSYKGNKI